VHVLRHFTWLLGLFVVTGIGGALLLLHKTSLGMWLHRYIATQGRRRLLLATVSFAATFALTRALTWSIDHHIGARESQSPP